MTAPKRKMTMMRTRERKRRNKKTKPMRTKMTMMTNKTMVKTRMRMTRMRKNLGNVEEIVSGDERLPPFMHAINLRASIDLHHGPLLSSLLHPISQIKLAIGL